MQISRTPPVLQANFNFKFTVSTVLVGNQKTKNGSSSKHSTVKSFEPLNSCFSIHGQRLRAKYEAIRAWHI